jgi:hypothetical protein
MIGTTPRVFTRLDLFRPRGRLADRYARWEYGMADAIPLLRDIERREPRRSRRTVNRGRAILRRQGRAHPLRLLAMLMAPRHR